MRAVDECLAAFVPIVTAKGGVVAITADHGNAEQMWDPANDCPHTAHTVYDVPLIAVGEALRGRRLRNGGCLADIAPSVLEILAVAVPTAMTGTSLLA